MKRGQTEVRRRVDETPLSRFVGARLAALGMKQSEFCRLTGFDQGLLSKIQSSMISKLNLETALRLAVGLSVTPGKIYALIGRKDLNDLIMKAMVQGSRATDRRVARLRKETSRRKRFCAPSPTDFTSPS